MDAQNKHFDFAKEFEDGSNLWDAEYNAMMDSMALKGLFFNEPWPFIALDLVADSISQVPMQVIRKSTDAQGNTNLEVVEDHQALTILENPNPMQNYSQWMYNLEIEIDLMGNGIVYYARNRKQLYIIPAETVSLDFDKDKLPRPRPARS
jgi:phage portal protein BeeE